MLWRVVKSIFGSKGRPPEAQASGEAVRTGSAFLRDPDIPSVLVCTHSYRGNGAAEMLLFLLRRLMLERKWQVHALSVDLAAEDREVLEGLGIGLVESADPDQYDFALANTLVSGLPLLKTLDRRLPCVLWAHEGEVLLWGCNWPVMDLKRTFAMAAHLVFQSAWQAERIFGSFISNLPDSRVSVIPNCLPSVPAAGQLPRPRNSGKKRVVFVGSVYGRKHPGDLAEAIVHLARQDVECIFVGDINQMDTLPERHRALLRDDSRFTLTGLVSREVATSYLASADALCLPSEDESQPLVLLEAAHFGVPIVISDLPVYRGTWVHGKNCLMHQVGDVQGLANCLGICLDGNAPRSEMPSEFDSSQERFLQRFGAIFDRLFTAGRQ